MYTLPPTVPVGATLVWNRSEVMYELCHYCAPNICCIIDALYPMN